MAQIVFILTMHSRNSWNGRCSGWNGRCSGDDNTHCIVKMFRNSKANDARIEKWLTDRFYYYSFGDGWGAQVDIKRVDAAEARHYRKLAQKNGFCGYDWMVDSIIAYDDILNSEQLKERHAQEREEREKERQAATLRQRLKDIKSAVRSLQSSVLLEGCQMARSGKSTHIKRRDDILGMLKQVQGLVQTLGSLQASVELEKAECAVKEYERMQNAKAKIDLGAMAEIGEQLKSGK